MLQMAEFVTHLHAQGQSLSTIIEHCVFIRVKDKRKVNVLFFYCQPFAALQYQYSFLSESEQLHAFRGYLPQLEIITNNPKPDDVDMWMMGKTFERIVSSWKASNGLEKYLMSSVEGVVRGMVTDPNHRLEMCQVWSYLWWYHE